MIPRAGTLLMAAVLATYTAVADLAAKVPRRIDISVTEDGFVPKQVTTKKGEPVTLVFTRRTDHTCAKDVVVYLEDGRTIARKLPLNQPVEVAVTFEKAGERGFACSMKMHGGAIIVE